MFEFDMFVDPADLLTDKAIIPSLGQWPHEYDKQAYRTHHGAFPVSAQKTESRVILDYLTRNDLELQRILGAISRGEVPDEWKVMFAVPICPLVCVLVMLTTPFFVQLRRVTFF